MNNRLRTEIPEEEQVELIVEEKPVKREIPDNFLTQLFSNEFITADQAVKSLPFVLFVALLGMIYIGNRHLAEKNIRDIDKLNKEVKELGWQYKMTKADLAFKSTLTQVESRVDTLGLKQPIQPPQKLVAKEVKDEY